MTLKELAQKLEIIVRKGVTDILMNEQIALNVQSKGYQDIVTAKDKLMEDYLIREIKALCPTDLFIAEEGHHNELTNDRTWIIDPIDGTLNFTQKNPNYGVQLALFENQEGLLSIIYLPAIDEYYYAIRGEGAFLNHQPLKVDPQCTLENSIVTFGDFSKSNPKSRGFQLATMGHLYGKALKIRIQGSSSIDFAFVAGSKNHAHILFSNRIWEIKPGLLLLEEAGAVTGILPGEDYGFPGNAVLVAASQSLFNGIVDAMSKSKIK